MQKIYFDNAATTSVNTEVISLMCDLMQSHYGNPSSIHQMGRTAKSLIEGARKDIANILGCDASEIIFTSGGTEANNLILFNAVKQLDIKRIVTAKIEHHAVLHTVEALKKDFNIEVDFVKTNKEGEIDLIHLNKLLKTNNVKTLVSLMHVNNEIGNILDLKSVSGICLKNKVLFHSDAVQGVAHLPINLKEIPVDFISASAHKFHGPKGIGFAIIRKKFKRSPIIYGGNQEKGSRAGTENVHSIAGMRKALEIAHQNLKKDALSINKLKQYFIEQLKANFKAICFNGLSSNLEKSAHHILNVRFNKEIPMILFQLDLHGIYASGGSACQSGSNKGSHVLGAILTPSEAKKTSIRFSFNKENTTDEVDRTIIILKKLCDK